MLALLLLGVYPAWLLWTGNWHVVTPGEFYRSGQLDRRELATVARRYHLRAVLNLRGSNPGKPWYDDEIGLCEDLGIEHVDFKMSAGSVVAPERVRELEALLRSLPKPLLVHCKAGADRSGFAAALYELRVRGGPADDAWRQLSWRYGHIPGFWGSVSSAMDRSLTRVLEASGRWTDSGASSSTDRALTRQ